MVKVATSKSAKLVMLELQIEIDWSGNFFKWLLDCETKRRTDVPDQPNEQLANVDTIAPLPH
jgi:hypothetical protein